MNTFDLWQHYNSSSFSQNIVLATYLAQICWHRSRSNKREKKDFMSLLKCVFSWCAKANRPKPLGWCKQRKPYQELRWPLKIDPWWIQAVLGFHFWGFLQGEPSEKLFSEQSCLFSFFSLSVAPASLKQSWVCAMISVLLCCGWTKLSA